MFGAAGRMGRMILSLAAQMPAQVTIVGAVEYATHPQIGQSLDQLIPGAPASIALAAQPPADAPPGTVAIHFSKPEATLEHLAWSREGGYGALIGTTGFNAAGLAAIEQAAARVPIVLASNTSLGVNVLVWLARQAARLLGPEYDIEIIEMHHHHKKDAPSGTAKSLAEAVLSERGWDYERHVRHGCEGIVGARPGEEVGMHAVRAGDIVGDHTVMLAGPGERLELTHRAHSREVFARGALQAAAWLQKQKPGLYSMKDVLGL